MRSFEDCKDLSQLYVVTVLGVQRGSIHVKQVPECLDEMMLPTAHLIIYLLGGLNNGFLISELSACWDLSCWLEGNGGEKLQLPLHNDVSDWTDHVNVSMAWTEKLNSA